MDSPAYKSLSSKQRYFKYILESIFELVIDSARDARYLNVTDEEAGQYSVTTPELSSKDLIKNSTVIRETTTSLVLAETNEWISKDTARQVFSMVIGYLGVEIDYDSEKEKLAGEGERKGFEDYTKANSPTPSLVKRGCQRRGRLKRGKCPLNRFLGKRRGIGRKFLDT